MKRSFLDSVLRGAEALAARDPVGTLPDADLLRRFAGGRDAAAFAMLVRRHGPLVWGVCRNLLPADADAEDAFQATFLALCRSAGSIRRSEALAGWLHGVAYRVALKARRAAARRKKRETTAAVPEPSSPVPDAAWDELQAAVHEEVCQLPDKLRLPFVLCGLQGRPQKEAAAALGWKLGTVSGRLSEARRVLLDRLARRGVPAGVGLGAAVLGGVAGQAAVPVSIRAKVLVVAGSPATASETVLSLARGVIPMYLTRSKLLAAGIVLAGVLTTGVGVLSKADAQGQPTDPAAETLKKYYDALRSQQAPKDRWEYKFIPVDRPLTLGDLQKVLAGADQEGWTYCGSQDLAAEKSGKATPHMVFKRPAGGVAADVIPGRKEAAAALLAELYAREQATKLRAQAEAQRRQAEVARDRAEAMRAEAEARARQVEADRAAKAAAEKAAASDRERAEVEARVRAEVEKAIQDAAKVRDLEAVRVQQAEKAARQLEAARRQELEAMKAKYEEAIRKLQDQLKANPLAPPAKKADPSGKKPEPQAAGDPFGAADKTATRAVRLKNAKAAEVAGTLSKLFPAARAVPDAATNSVILTGPVGTLAEAQTLLDHLLDAPADKADKAKPEFITIAVDKAHADDVARVLGEMFGEKGPKVRSLSGNRLLVFGTPTQVADAKKVVTALEATGGPAK